jgi:hypothetical protein
MFIKDRLILVYEKLQYIIKSKYISLIYKI